MIAEDIDLKYDPKNPPKAYIMKPIKTDGGGLFQQLLKMAT